MARDAGQIQTMAKAVMRPVFHALWRVKTTGLENVPDTGPAILAPNHISVIDSFMLPARAAAAHHLRGQGRVHGRLEDQGGCSPRWA